MRMCSLCQCCSVDATGNCVGDPNHHAQLGEMSRMSGKELLHHILEVNTQMMTHEEAYNFLFDAIQSRNITTKRVGNEL